MGISKIQELIQNKKVDKGDSLAIAIVDLCFVTSYKIEELITMPPKRLNLLLERYKFHYCKEKK